jgi:hypothetical protein
MYHEFLMPYVKLMSIVNKHFVSEGTDTDSRAVTSRYFTWILENARKIRDNQLDR